MVPLEGSERMNRLEREPRSERASRLVREAVGNEKDQNKVAAIVQQLIASGKIAREDLHHETMKQAIGRVWASIARLLGASPTKDPEDQKGSNATIGVRG
jgi:hypothetical protein